MRQRFLTALARAISRWPLLFIVAGLLGAGLAAWYTVGHLQFKTSRNDLIGRDSEYWRFFSEYAREFRAEEDYIVVVESDSPQQNRAAIDALIAALLDPANNPDPADRVEAQLFQADDVYYHVDFKAMEPWFLYYLSTNELQQIEGSLGEFNQLVTILREDSTLATFLSSMSLMLERIEHALPSEREPMLAFVPTITRIIEQMGEPPPADDQTRWLSPWASAFFSEEMLAEAEEEMQWQGYQTFLGGRMFIALVHPRNEQGERTVSSAATIDKLRRIIASVREQFPQLSIQLTGELVLDHDEMTVSRQDATRATLLTLLVIAVLFAFSFHEILRPALAVLSMVIALALSLGFATWSVGHLNLITVTFAVMILGLGIDLGIQLIARYEEELARQFGRVESLARAIEQTGTSIITAGVTNAAAFFAMGLSGFNGVAELGIIAGGGMLIATSVTMLFLPALLLVVKRQGETVRIPAQAAASRFERLLLARPGWVLAACAIITVGAVSVAWRVRFDYNVLSLQSRELESVQTEMRLLGADVESTIFAAVVTDRFEEVRRLHDELAALPTVATVHSIAELIPLDQEPKVPIIRRIREQLGEIGFQVPPADLADAALTLRALSGLRLRAASLQQALPAENDKMAARVLGDLASAARGAVDRLRQLDEAARQQRLRRYQEQFYADLQTQLELMAHQHDQPMELADVTPEIRRMLIGKSGKFLIRVFPRENIWNRDELVRFVRDIQSVAPQATGTPLGLYEFVDILLRGYRNAAAWAFVVIVILVLVDLRSFRATLLAVIPLLVGMAWMLGAMSLFGLRFNPANIIVLPLLVGIGVAYGIYVVQRFREERSAEFYHKSTGRAVVLSAVTTIVAFASLILGAHRGIRSLGIIMSLGVTACLVAAMLLLPALLELARRRGWKV